MGVGEGRGEHRELRGDMAAHFHSLSLLSDRSQGGRTADSNVINSFSPLTVRAVDILPLSPPKHSSVPSSRRWAGEAVRARRLTRPDEHQSIKL